MKKRIVFVINSLHTGGAERVLDRLLRHCGDRAARYDLHVVLLDDEPQMIDLPPVASLHVLDGRGKLGRSVIQLNRLLGTLDPDLVVSMLVRANVATALSVRRRRGRAILCERMHLGSHLAGRYAGLKLRILQWLPRHTYPMADRVLGVSDGVTANLVEEFGLDPALTQTIYNPYDLEEIAAQGREEPEIALPPRFIVAVGRFVKAKNFAMLIDAYASARPGIPLLILGDGEERPQLEAQVKRLGLSGQILLPGYVRRPFPIVARADFLASASRNEGFPNAIAEAMALGIPVLATDCPSGPAELLGGHGPGNGEVCRAAHGLLVANNDEAGLAEGIEMMMQDETRRHYAAAGSLRIRDFTIDAIAAQYWSLFDELAEAPQP